MSKLNDIELRDYFAGQALFGMIYENYRFKEVNEVDDDYFEETYLEEEYKYKNTLWAEVVAINAYAVATEMMKARNITFEEYDNE